MSNRKQPKTSAISLRTDISDRGPQVLRIEYGNYTSYLNASFQFFSVLAYPEKEHWIKRERFIFELTAEMYQTYEELGGEARNVPAGYLRRTGGPGIEKRRENYLKRGRRLIRGGFALGFKRIFQRRIIAGGAALAAWRRANSPELAAVIVREYLRNSWLQKEGGRYVGDVEQQAVRFRDFKRSIWVESLPVLHLAASLHIALLQYQPEIPGNENPAIPRAEKLQFMLKDPRWVPGTLAYADSKLLTEFDEWIPDFDAARAIRLIPE